MWLLGDQRCKPWFCDLFSPSVEVHYDLKWGLALFCSVCFNPLTSFTYSVCICLYMSLTKCSIVKNWLQRRKHIKWKIKRLKKRGEMLEICRAWYHTHTHTLTTLSYHLTAVAINVWWHVEVRAWGLAFTRGAANSDKTGRGREVTAGLLCSTGVVP